MPWAWSDELEAIHTHRWPNVQYVLSSPDFIRRDGEGALETLGNTDLRVIMVELKG